MKCPRPLAAVCSLTLGLLVVALASPAAAQSAVDAKPWTPHEYSRSELINFGTYDAPPLVFEWDVVEVSQKPVNQRLDFVLTFAEDYDTVTGFLRDAYAAQQPVAKLAPEVMGMQTQRELVIVGLSTGDDPARFTLSGKGMNRRFTIDVTDEGGRAVIRLHNIVMSRLFSGVVPSVTPFQPVGAAPVPLLWQ